MEKVKKKKGLFTLIKESMTKSGGCCGPGSSCCGPTSEKDEKKAENKDDKKRTDKAKK
ncbi:MAG: hypothetical protein AABY87_09355 [bacterium]